MKERQGFPEIVPKFVIEIVSPSDSLTKQHTKMEEYGGNGVALGWLIIPKDREIHVCLPLIETRCRNSKQRRLDEGKKDSLGFVGYFDDDTFVTTESYDICLRATAAWIRAVDHVLSSSSSTSSSTHSTMR